MADDNRIHAAHAEDRELEPGTWWSVSTDFVHIRLRHGARGDGDLVLELTFADPYAPPEQSKGVPNVRALRDFVEQVPGL